MRDPEPKYSATATTDNAGDACVLRQEMASGSDLVDQVDCQSFIVHMNIPKETVHVIRYLRPIASSKALNYRQQDADDEIAKNDFIG